MKNIIEVNQDRFPLDYNNFKSVLDKTHRNPLATDIVCEHTHTPEKLTNMLRELYPQLNDRGIKNQFTRLIRTIEALEEKKLDSDADLLSEGEKKNYTKWIILFSNGT